MRPKIKQSSLEPCRHHCRPPDDTMKSEVPSNFEGLPGFCGNKRRKEKYRREAYTETCFRKRGNNLMLVLMAKEGGKQANMLNKEQLR